MVRVQAACVCRSDLWPYRSENEVDGPHGIGHEQVGVVEAFGTDVGTVRVGDVVVSPFTFSRRTRASRLAGVDNCRRRTARWSPSTVSPVTTRPMARRCAT